MTALLLDIPADTYTKLKKKSQQIGKTLERYSYELLEEALSAQENLDTREALLAMGRVRPLSDGLRRKIIPGITLTEVHSIMERIAQPSLSDIILEQRGSKD